jgi:hypothetical protein
MPLQQAPVRNVFEYLTQDRVIRIPLWQREYSWKATEAGQVGVLMSDLKEFIESGDSEYLIGSVILCQDEENINHRLLIDGQQRSMTLLILLMAARKFIKNEGLDVPDGHPLFDVVPEIKACISAAKDEYKERIYMNQQNANNILEELYLWSTASDTVNESVLYNADRQNPTEQNLVNVAKYIYQEQFKKNKWISKENDQFLLAINKVLHSVRFVEMNLSNQSEAIAVYDHINDRGLPLSSADLIKNRIFQNVSDSDFPEVSLNWNEMTKTLSGCDIATIKDPKFLLRSIAAAETGQKITYKALTQHFGDKFKKDKDDPIEFAFDLSVCATFLRDYSETSSHELHGALPELYFPNSLGSVQQYPLLIAARNIKEKKVFKRVIKQIANRTAFYTLSAERTQEFESLVPKWAKAIQDPNLTIAKADEAYIENANISDEGLNRLRSVMSELNYESSSDRAKIRAILARLSWILDEKVGKHATSSFYQYYLAKKEKDGTKAWDIDHVLPSKGNANDPVIHGLGNLILLYPTDNRSAQAAKPINKEAHYQQNPLYLTKSLTDMDKLVPKDKEKVVDFFKSAGVKELKWNLETWNEESIKHRFELYFSLLKNDLTTF